MRLNMNRRYWGGFQVEEVEFSRLDGSERTGRWLNFAAPAGTIAFSLERKVLLSVLNFRYGRNKGDTASAAVDEATVRVRPPRSGSLWCSGNSWPARWPAASS